MSVAERAGNAPAAEGTAPQEDDAAAAGSSPEPEDPDKVKPVLFIALTITGLLALGAFQLVFDLEDNGCGMTYMYEYPEYINIDMSDHIEEAYPKYGLYAYGEGKVVSSIKAGKFDGIPVLFIPGNSGSFKQVRSMASVALRKAVEETEYKVHFDYFALDFDEEMPALYGGSLNLQSEYARHAVRKILSLYQTDRKGSGSPPASVVILGHSLGGLVGKSLFLDPAFNPALVQVLVTLATPSIPVLLLDPATHHFYRKVDDLWYGTRDSTLSQITLVNIAGGERDLQVRAGLCQDSYGDLNVVASAVPAVWVSTDHRCIVWCKQLMLALNRVLFDMIGPVSKQISRDSNLRRDIVNYHLYQRSGGKEYSADMHPAQLKFDINGYWSDVIKRQFTFTKGNATCNHYVMVKVNADVNHRSLTLDAVRMDAEDWVFGCKETRIYKNTLVCDEGDNLSGLAKIMPSKGKRKALTLDMHKLKKEQGYSHVVVHTPVHTESTQVSIDLYDPRERSITFQVPKWITFWNSYDIIAKTLPGAVFYNISLVSIDHPWQAYKVSITPKQCKNEKDKVHFGLARFITPWANDTTQILVGPGMNNTITAKLMTSKPAALPADLHPQIHLYLNPACTYTVSIKAGFPEMMGQLIRFYAPMLVPCVSMVVMLILAFQIRRFEEGRFCKSPLLILMANVSPMSVVLPSRMVAYVAAVPALAAFLPVTDIALLQERGLDFGVLPIMLVFGSIGLVFLLISLLGMAVIGCGSGLHKALQAYSARFGMSEVAVELAVSTIERFPAILSAIIIAVGFGSCGSLALCLGCFCYFLKVSKMYEEYLDGLVKRSVGLEKEDDPSLLSGVNFQFTLALLWLISTVINLPTLLAWTQNIDKGVGLPCDPSLIHAVILSVSLAVLWQNEGKPAEDKKFYSVCAIAIQFSAIMVATFGTVSMYRVPFAISAVFVAVASHQLIAPTEEDGIAEEKDDVTATASSKTTSNKKKVKSSAEKCDDSDSQDGSGTEYEYKYKLSMQRKRIDKKKFKVLKSDSQTTDTGFGEEGLDWELENEDDNGQDS